MTPELKRDDRRALRLADKLVQLIEVGAHVGVDTAVLIATAHALIRARGRRPKCWHCGCTDKRGCPDGCEWSHVEVCSSCWKPEAFK